MEHRRERMEMVAYQINKILQLPNKELEKVLSDLTTRKIDDIVNEFLEKDDEDKPLGDLTHFNQSTELKRLLDKYFYLKFRIDV